MTWLHTHRLEVLLDFGASRPLVVTGTVTARTETHSHSTRATGSETLV